MGKKTKRVDLDAQSVSRARLWRRWRRRRRVAPARTDITVGVLRSPRARGRHPPVSRPLAPRPARRGMEEEEEEEEEGGGGTTRETRVRGRTTTTTISRAVSRRWAVCRHILFDGVMYIRRGGGALPSHHSDVTPTTPFPLAETPAGWVGEQDETRRKKREEREKKERRTKNEEREEERRTKNEKRKKQRGKRRTKKEEDDEIRKKKK